MSKKHDSPTSTFFNTTFKVVLFFAAFFVFLLLVWIFDARAETVTTSVTVGNAAPEFTVDPFEDPVSSTASPTNVGDDVTWKATATDANNDDYYLIICPTDSVNPGTNGAPSCGGGDPWCTSSRTTSGEQASCDRTALAGDDYLNDWYGFVCDHLASDAACSDSSQGSGPTGSPFVVNHAPTFTSVDNAPGNADPGGSITWTTVASDPNNYDVKLLVCQTEGIENGSCTGDAWCESSLTASNPSCTYNVPSVEAASTEDAYVYIVDEFDFPAVGSPQGSNVDFTINNVAPVVSTVTINSGNNIILESGTTKEVVLTATVTDQNSCQDIDTVEGFVYRSGIGYSNCDSSGDADDNNCYVEIECSEVAESCTGPTDASANYTCTVNMQYFADPTDALTEFSEENWFATIKATDNGGLSDDDEVSQGVDVNSLNAFSITGAINYGSLGAGESNETLEQVVTTTPTGNIGLNQEHSGEDMCIGYSECTGSTPIGVANQRYALLTNTDYSEGTQLSTSATLVEIKVPKPTSTSPDTRNTWWGILIPSGTEAGAYAGENTITSVKSDVSDW